MRPHTRIQLRIPLAAPLLAALLLASPSSAADEEPDYSKPSLYLGGAIAWSAELFDNFTPEPGVVENNVGDSFGFDGRVGWRAHRIFAIELEMDLTEGFDSSGGDIDTLVWTGNARVYPLAYALRDRFQPWVLVGGGAMVSSRKFVSPTDPRGESTKDFGSAVMRFGLGLDVHLSERFALTGSVGHVLPFGDNEGLQYVPIAVGFLYTFPY